MPLNNFLLAAIDDGVAKLLCHKATRISRKVGNGESHSCIIDYDSLVDFGWKPHKSYFKLPPEPTTHFT